MKKRQRKASAEQIAAVKAVLARIFWWPGKGTVVNHSQRKPT